MLYDYTIKLLKDSNNIVKKQQLNLCESSLFLLNLQVTARLKEAAIENRFTEEFAEIIASQKKPNIKKKNHGVFPMKL